MKLVYDRAREYDDMFIPSPFKIIDYDFKQNKYQYYNDLSKRYVPNQEQYMNDLHRYYKIQQDIIDQTGNDPRYDNKLMDPGHLISCDAYFDPDEDERMKENLYSVYRRQIPIMNTNPDVVRINKVEKSDNIDPCYYHQPYDDLEESLENQNKIDFEFAGGKLLMVPGKTPEGMYIPYNDWLELIGKQLAASNANVVQSNQPDKLDSIKSVLTSLISNISGKNSSDSSTQASGSGLTLKHLNRGAIKEMDLTGAYDHYPKYLRHAYNDSMNMMTGAGMSNRRARNKFIKAYKRIHGDDMHYLNEMIKEEKAHIKKMMKYIEEMKNKQ